VYIDAQTGDDNGGKERSGEPEWFLQERGYTASSFPGQLYNLRDDLIQRQNLYAEKPEIVQRLKALLEKYKTEGRSVAPRREVRPDAATD
jgi:arylsulfatase A